MIAEIWDSEDYYEEKNRRSSSYTINCCNSDHRRDEIYTKAKVGKFLDFHLIKGRMSTIPARVLAISSSQRNQLAPTPRWLNISIDEGRFATKTLGIVMIAMRIVETQKVIFTFFETVAIWEIVKNKIYNSRRNSLTASIGFTVR